MCLVDSFCCDGAWDDMCVDAANELCLLCGAVLSDCCAEPSGLPGCVDPACEATVCSVDGYCCEVSWDLTCVDEAGYLCPLCGAVPSDCCVPHGLLGCDDAGCEAEVCGADPFCCETAWDEMCSDLAVYELCVDLCVPPVSDCCTTATEAPGCMDPACEATVCAWDPFCCEVSWDVGCVGAAVDLCPLCAALPSDCCALTSELPGCVDPGCEATVCGADPFCCDSAWDDVCVEAANDLCPLCGVSPGGCCLPHDAPGCDDPGCEAAVCEADPFCCETAWDELCADAAVEVCQELCGPMLSDCCTTATEAPGCMDPECEATVCAWDPFCCEVSWDVGCVGAAVDLCPLCAALPSDCCTMPSDHPGCMFPECEAQVCGADPFCCETAWDGLCVDAANALCAVCGAAPSDCCLPHDTPGCDDFACAAEVCAADPFCCETAWDDLCADAAAELCGSLCGGLPSDCCTTPSELPGCVDPGCTGIVCSADPFCCETAWDDMCVVVAAELCPLCGPVVSDCCATPSELPGCVDPGCEAMVCEGDAFCCDSAWDGVCVAAANELCPICGEAPSDCCTEPSELPGCIYPECEATVCALDPFCCDAAWDGLCVDTANALCAVCGAAPSDCCLPHDAPGCDDFACAAEVCGADPFCCETTWDDLCADAAAELCGPLCGVLPSDCCETPSELPGCVDPGCEATVCEGDPFCCDSAWDDLCVEAANGLCPLCGVSAGDCCVPHDLPGCDDPECEATVCEVDPFCCEAAWDGLCADEAAELCGGLCGPLPSDCCTEPSELPGCADPECAALVCAVDAYCCESAWDDICVDMANALCPVCGPVASDCCTEPSALPGCTAFECEAIVCEWDPFCCVVSWDVSCVGAANELCPLCGAMPSDCCAVPSEHPGCMFPECAATVCLVDPFCCETAWDGLCVDAANALCAVCGAAPSDCCLPHDAPGCDDPGCELEVCAADPFCCDTTWDDLCADAAAALCGPLCGALPSDCCTALSDLPGCVYPECEAQVCAADPYCCESAWDAMCVDAADELCPLCGPLPSDCCTAPSELPGCVLPECAATVCLADPFCCETAWDGACVTAANELCPVCGLAPSDCCAAPSELPGCIYPECEAQVCATDPFCCETAWDGLCVDAANELCAVCGAAPSDCCLPHDAPGCDDPGCELEVCEADPFCCETAWDALCADASAALCGPLCGALPSDCCTTPSELPGCIDPACAAEVCAADPFCCESAWDAMCVEAANELCALCGASPGDCCAPHELPGCDDPGCEAVVCATDPFCCEAAWDTVCADEANELCGPLCAMLPSDCCAAPSELPGCMFPECAATVCLVDPFCCESAWDGLCVDAANELCAVCGAAPGDCCLPHDAPGCDDPPCEAAVCGADPFCCESSWDGLCAEAALELCGGLCGPAPSDCCVAPSELPGCIDPACAATVCAVDPFCCDVSWDPTCVGAANGLCPLCGAAPSDCCAAHELPGCDDPACTATVCAADPFCCETAWDDLCADAALELCGGLCGPAPSDCCVTPRHVRGACGRLPVEPSPSSTPRPSA